VDRVRVAVLTLLILVGVCAPQLVVGQTHATPAATDITLVIDFGNGTRMEFTGLEGDTVLNVTQSAVEVEVEWYGDLVFVTSIAGVSNDPEHNLWWQYWVNGELGPVAVNKYHLNNGDVVEWRLPGHSTSTSSTGPTYAPVADPSLTIGTLSVAVFGLSFLVLLYVRRTRT